MQNRPYNTSDADGEIAKLQASPFFNSVIREFLTMTGKPEEQLKARSFIYIVGNNANILGPIQLVGRQSFGRAPFGSVFFFELYVDKARQAPYTEADLLVRVGWRNFQNLYYNNTEDDGKAVGDFRRVDPVGLVPYEQAEWYTEDLCGVGKSYCTIADLRRKIYTDDEWKTQCEISINSPLPDDENKEGPESEGGGGGGGSLNASGKALLAVVIVLAVLLVAAIVVAVVFFVRAQLATAAVATTAEKRGKGSVVPASADAPAKKKYVPKSGSSDNLQPSKSGFGKGNEKELQSEMEVEVEMDAA